MKPSCQFIVFSIVIVVASSQRSPYAGRRPIGYPIIEATTSANNLLGNKFGENENATTQRLPIEALGDRELVNRVGQYPQDKQPFWLLNWQALEEHRKRPQSFNIRPSIFVDPIIPQNRPNQQDSVLNNRNGQNVQQNLGQNDQVGQNSQQNSSLKEQNVLSSEQNVRPSETIAQDTQQNLRTNLPNNQNILQNVFPTTRRDVQVNPTPPQVMQASWTMAANV